MQPPLPDTLTESDLKDQEHLKLLVIFHYVEAGILAFFSCFPIIHIAFGIMMVSNPEFLGNNSSPSNQPPLFVGWLFIAMGTLFMLGGWALATCTFFSGKFIARRQKKLFSFIIAGVLCTFMPFGTVLGIFTLIVLNRPSVQRLYAAR